MADSQNPAPKTNGAPSGNNDDIAAVTSEDLSIEQEREALKKARDADAPDPAGGEGAAGYGNLHFGDQEQGEFKDPAQSGDAPAGDVSSDSDDAANLTRERNDAEDGDDGVKNAVTNGDGAERAPDAETAAKTASAPDAQPDDPQNTPPSPDAAPTGSGASSKPSGEGEEPTGANVERTPVNEAPTDIELSGSSVDENDAGAAVAILSTSDPDADDTATYSITEDSSGLFEIVGDEVRLRDGVSLDHESQDTYEIVIQVEDSAGNLYSETVTINVNDLNEGPSNVQLSNTTIDENDAGAVVGTVSAVDPDEGDSLTYTVSDERFEIVGNELRVKEGVSFDHETVDAIDVTVTATDSGGLEASQSFTVNIADVNEGPSDVQLSNTTIEENDAGAVVGTVSAVDPDDGDTLTYTVSDDRFEVVGNELRVKEGVSFDHENVDAIDVTVTATDSGGLEASQSFTVNIADVNEGPSNVQLSNTTIDENDAGAVVGTVSAVDPDEGDSLTYTVSDDRFEIVGNELRVKEGVSFDHETVDAIDVTVTATDSGGLEASQSFTVNVADINEAPTDLELIGTAVSENDAGALVGILLSSDPDADDTATFSIAEDASGLFEVVGNELKLKDGASLDYETKNTYDITIEVTDSAGDSHWETFTVNVTNVLETNLIEGTNRSETLVGGGSSDEIYAGGGNDRVYGRGDDDFIFGEGGRDYLRGGAGNDLVDGGAGNDVIFGDAGADQLYGGAGNDRIYADSEDTVVEGGAGNDRVIVRGGGDFSIDMTASSVERVDAGSGDDTLDASGSTARVTQRGNGGDDTLIGGENRDNQHGGSGDDTIFGNGGRDNIRGGSGDDVIDGGAGNDVIRGDAGADELRGGDGNDLIYADSDDTVVEGGAGTDRVIVRGGGDFSIDMTASGVERVDGGSGDDTLDATGSTTRVTQLGNRGDDALIGGENRDTQRGGAGDDVIYGGGGNDNIRGDAGADELRGGDGNDLIYADSDDTVVEGGAGTDRVIVQGNGDFSIDMTASGVERVDANSGNDTLDATGSTARVRQYGNGGDDTLIGGENRDTQRGGAGDDIIYGGGGNDVIRGDAGADELRGGEGNDLIYADSDDTVVEGGAGNDRVIVQGDGDFSIDMTASGVERVDGGAGDDTLDASGSTSRVRQYGNDGDDTLIGGEGRDIQQGGDGDDTISGGGDRDNIRGGEGADRLSGDEGRDTIRGDAGDDVIIGGDDNDTLYGGDGSDVFVYEMGDGSDRVFGGSGGWTDTIQLGDGDSPLGEYGVDWTIEVTEGSIVSVDEDGITLSEDSDGVITLSNGSTIEFSDIEEILI